MGWVILVGIGATMADATLAAVIEGKVASGKVLVGRVRSMAPSSTWYPRDFDEWAALGNTGWSIRRAAVLPQAETNENGGDAYGAERPSTHQQF